MRHFFVSIAVGIGLLCVVVLIWPKRDGSSVSTTFVRYGTQFGLTNQLFGFFLVSNNGPHRVFCGGVADNCCRLYARVLESNDWVEFERPLATFPHGYYLTPGDTREVGVHLEKTNLSWMIGFRYREIGFVDFCPAFVWQRLPEQMQPYPKFCTVWTQPVKGYVTN